jgi:hypothetical protein
MRTTGFSLLFSPPLCGRTPPGDFQKNALACIIHEVLFSDDFFERETKRDYWRKELELKG